MDTEQHIPEWAKAVIVAVPEEDRSDIQTDLFLTRTGKPVLLAWSKHTRDLFSEMRKAAATWDRTKHLGPGKGVYTCRVVASQDIKGGRIWKGQASPWHHELDAEFDTMTAAQEYVANKGAPYPIIIDGIECAFEWAIWEQKIEHREKYSMGSGYYLKAGIRYSTGWRVEKWPLGMYFKDAVKVAIAENRSMLHGRVLVAA